MVETTDLPLRIVLAVNDDQRSILGFNWLRDCPLGIWTEDVQLDIVHVVKEDRDKVKGLELLKTYDLWAKTTFPENLVVKTKLLQSKDGPGVGLKDYTRELNPKLLVLSSSNTSSLKHRLMGGVTDYCTRFCTCPVVVIKRDRRADIKTNREKTVHVAIGVDTTGPSDNAVNWFLNTANLTNSSTLVIVHAVTKPSDKPNARKFLASYQSRCIASKKEYTMKSGLVYFKGKNVPDSITKYCREYSVDLLILAPNSSEGIKLTGSTTDAISRTIDCDYLIWKPSKRPHLEIKTRDLVPRQRQRRASLDAQLAKLAQKEKEKAQPRRWSTGAGADDQENDHHGDSKPEEVAYIFHSNRATLSP
jgi:nucleotide-binding universal stress UspA family protein